MFSLHFSVDLSNGQNVPVASILRCSSTWSSKGNLLGQCGEEREDEHVS